MENHPTPPAKGWWIGPLIFGLLFLAGLAVVWQVSETGRELLAKSFMTLAGYLATPFVLEITAALTGLIIVLVYNEWRRSKDGPDWVVMEVKEEKKPEAADKSADS